MTPRGALSCGVKRGAPRGCAHRRGAVLLPRPPDGRMIARLWRERIGEIGCPRRVHLMAPPSPECALGAREAGPRRDPLRNLLLRHHHDNETSIAPCASQDFRGGNVTATPPASCWTASTSAWRAGPHLRHPNHWFPRSSPTRPWPTCGRARPLARWPRSTWDRGGLRTKCSRSRAAAGSLAQLVT